MLMIVFVCIFFSNSMQFNLMVDFIIFQATKGKAGDGDAGYVKRREILSKG